MILKIISVALRVVAVASWLIALVWLIREPGYESVLAFLSGLTFIATSFFVDNYADNNTTDAPYSTSSSQMLTDRQKMLRKVRNFWIDGVLENSLHDAVWIELGLQVASSSVDHPWGMTLRREGYHDEYFSTSKDIHSVFEDVGGALLILGEPGSGKTTTLLTLADHLLQEAELDVSAPIPVIFNLSSWVKNRQSIQMWLVEELELRYQVPGRIARFWVKRGAILPLLDGLDEVKNVYRDACIEAINSYRASTGLSDIAVCSRIQEYNESTIRLTLHSAVTIEPLTEFQIEKYFDAGGEAFRGARAAFRRDRLLKSLARTPLFLNIIALAYSGLDAEQIPVYERIDEQRAAIFNTYIKQMLHRVRGENLPPTKLLKWLNHLALAMRERSQTMFLIEELQPNWLLQSDAYILNNREDIGVRLNLRFLFYLFATRTAVGLVLGLAVGVSFAIASSVTYWFLKDHTWGILGVEIGFVSAASIGLGTFSVDIIRSKTIDSTSKINSLAGVSILYTVSIAFAAGVIVHTMRGWHNDVVLTGIASGLVFGIFLGLREKGRAIINEIQIVEKLHFSTRSALSASALPLAAGLVVGWSLGQLRQMVEGRIVGETLEVIASFFRAALYQFTAQFASFPLSLALIFGLTGGIVFGMLGGFKGRQFEIRTYPNQGMHLTFRNAIVIWIVMSLVFGLFFGVAHSRIGGWYVPGLVVGCLFGSFFGILASLWHGGIDVIRHGLLRCILAIDDHIPLNCVPALNTAADRLILRRVGGGFIFVHLYLLEHIADLTEKEIMLIGQAEYEGEFLKVFPVE